MKRIGRTFRKKASIPSLPSKKDEEFPLMWNTLSLEFLNRVNAKQITKNTKSSFKDFQMIDILGEGGFGKVVLSKENSTGNYVAIKIMEKSFIVKKKQMQIAVNEKQILSFCRFQYILMLVTAFQTNDFVCLCLELAPGGDLFELMQDNTPFSMSITRFYSSQIVLGIQYLHTMQIVYRDLKPENILISRNGYVKLADMGFAKLLMHEPRTYTFCGTPEYIAPEIILNKGYGCAVDWWSFGVMVYEMLVGITPFFNKEPMVMYNRITHGGYRLPQNLLDDAIHLIKLLLQVDVTRRYGNLRNGALDVRYHHFYNSINWVSIKEQTVCPPFPLKDVNYESIPINEKVKEIKDRSLRMQYEKEFFLF